MRKIALIILSLRLSGSVFCQTSSNLNEDSCQFLYSIAGDLHLGFNKDTLQKALKMFDRVIESNCSQDVKNFCLYNKAQTLHKLGCNKEALVLLKESKFPEWDSLLMSYVYQDRYYIYRDIGKNKKALNEINRAIRLNPDNEFIYRKSELLFELGDYNHALAALSKITLYAYPDHESSINKIKAISAYKTGQFDISNQSCELIIDNKERYNDMTVNTAALIQLLIKRKAGILTEQEKQQITSLGGEEIYPVIKKELK